MTFEVLLGAAADLIGWRSAESVQVVSGIEAGQTLILHCGDDRPRSQDPLAGIRGAVQVIGGRLPSASDCPPAGGTTVIVSLPQG